MEAKPVTHQAFFQLPLHQFLLLYEGLVCLRAGQLFHVRLLVLYLGPRHTHLRPVQNKSSRVSDKVCIFISCFIIGLTIL